MTPERWQQLKPLFFEAMELPPDQRDAFLDRACDDDDALRADLDALLAADRDADDALGAAYDDLAALAHAEARDAEDATDALLGRAIGPYQLRRRLGHGGMGTVYLAEQNDGVFRRYVALKVIRDRHASDEIMRRFHLERQILAALNHPHIARLLDGGTTDDGIPYFVMEHVEGQPLLAYCDSRRLGVEDRLGLFRMVCEAVHYAHQNLIVHRDLKPSNILVTPDGTVKLLDFGIAKLLNPNLAPHGPAITQTDFRVMTPAYASPEQVRGEPITTASDVYSLGVVLYELLTGHPPYRLPSRMAAEVHRVICETEPERPSTAINRVEEVTRGDGTSATITPEGVSEARNTVIERLRRRLHGDLDNIVLMAMRKEPQRRYASAEQFGEDLRRHLDGEAVLARKPTVGYRLQKFVRRHRFGVATAAAFVGLLLTFGFLYTNQLTRERDRARQAALQAEQVTDFMLRVFKGSTPDEALGDTITARTLLEGGVRRVENELADEPVVQARLLDAMGEAYFSLGRYDRARPLLERGLALRRAHLGDDAPETAESLHHLAWLIHAQRDYETADSLARRGLAIQARHLAPTDLPFAAGLFLLGTIAFSRNHLGEADSLFRRVLAVRQERLGRSHPETINVLYKIAITLHGLRDTEGAKRLIENAVADVRQAPPALTPEGINSLWQLARLLQFQSDHAGAEVLYRQILDMRRALYGEHHPQTASALHFLSGANQWQSDYEEALAFGQAALEQINMLYGPESFRAAEEWSMLGNIYLGMGDYPPAEAAYREAFRILRTLDDLDHPISGQWRLVLARAIRLQGRREEAQPLLAEAERLLRGQQTLSYETHYAYVQREQAYYHLAQGRPEEAERLLHEALARIGKYWSPRNSWAIPEIESLLGHILTRKGRYAEAESLLVQSLATFEAQKTGRFSHLHIVDRLIGETRARLADLYDAWARPEEAARYRDAAE